MWILRVADMVFGCSRYYLAVADVVTNMVCGRYGRTPLFAVK